MRRFPAELLYVAAAVVVAAIAFAASPPADPEDPPRPTELPAPIGRASAPARPPEGVPPAPEGCFVAVREPGGLDLPWAHRIRTGDQVELAGRWYRVAGPAPEGEYTPAEWLYLDGDRPADVEAVPYRATVAGVADGR